MMLGRDDGATALMGRSQPGRLQTRARPDALRNASEPCGLIFRALSLDQLGQRLRGVRPARGEVPLVIMSSEHAKHRTRSAHPNRDARRAIYASRIHLASELPIVNMPASVDELTTRRSDAFRIATRTGLIGPRRRSIA